MSIKVDPHRDPDDDTAFIMEGERAWIRVKGFDVCIVKTDEGVVVDIWNGPDTDSPYVISSAQALDGE